MDYITLDIKSKSILLEKIIEIFNLRIAMQSNRSDPSNWRKHAFPKREESRTG